MMLLNVKLDVIGYKRIIFQGSRIHWSCSFLNGTAKMKLVILTFLPGREFVKTLLQNTTCSVWCRFYLLSIEWDLIRLGNMLME